MKNKVCDFDCFNCIYDDCIEDSTVSPYGERPKKTKSQIMHDYYEKNKAKIKKKNLEYYHKHKQEILQKKKEERNASKCK